MIATLSCAAEREAHNVEDARAVFDKYELAFAQCKTITEAADARPGTHSCTRVSSEALERSLEEAGVDEATRDELIAAWVGDRALGVFYANEEARAGLPGF